LLEDVSTIVFAPSKAATCGSSDCAAAPMIQFGDQTRVSGRVLDGEGEPISDANVELFIEQPGVGLNDLNPTVGADGRWCAGVYPGTRVGVSAGRSSAGISVSASSVVQVAPFTHAACGGDCQVTPDLVLPRYGCITGTTTDANGYPLATGSMAISTPDGKLVGTRVGTDGMGHYCLNAPRSTDLVFRAVDNNRAYAEQTLRLGKGAETSCKTGGCDVGPSLTLVNQACLSGQVVDEMGVPTPDVELRIYTQGPTGIESQLTTPDPTGAFCAQVAAGAAVDVVVRGTSAATMGLGAALHTRASATPGTCGSCTTQVQLALGPARPCVRGVAYARSADFVSRFVPPAVPITVYDGAFPTTPVCTGGSSDPATWGQRIGAGVVGNDGAFCVELPALPSTNKGTVVFGDCVFQSGSASCLRQTKAVEFRDVDGCAGHCVDLGRVDVPRCQ